MRRLQVSGAHASARRPSEHGPATAAYSVDHGRGMGARASARRPSEHGRATAAYSIDHGRGMGARASARRPSEHGRKAPARTGAIRGCAAAHPHPMDAP